MQARGLSLEMIAAIGGWGRCFARNCVSVLSLTISPFSHHVLNRGASRISCGVIAHA
jgi:hypothetical protein